LVEYLANVSERVKRAPAIEMERIVSGRQFRSGEKRGCGVGKTKRGKGTKWMVVVDGRGLPLGNYLHSASPAEVKLAETTLATIRVGRSQHSGRPRQKPMRVIADKAYDSDPLRKRLRQRGIELICPHKRNRVRPATQDGSCDVTSGDGSWNVPMPGWETSGAWLCATTVRSQSMVLFFISPAG
jgi:hypothetical protein